MTLEYFYFDKTKEYARLLKKQDELEKELKSIKNEKNQLGLTMSEKELTKAYKLYLNSDTLE